MVKLILVRHALTVDNQKSRLSTIHKVAFTIASIISIFIIKKVHTYIFIFFKKSNFNFY